jgi:hypothetical protein
MEKRKKPKGDLQPATHWRYVFRIWRIEVSDIIAWLGFAYLFFVHINVLNISTGLPPELTTSWGKDIYFGSIVVAELSVMFLRRYLGRRLRVGTTIADIATFIAVLLALSNVTIWGLFTILILVEWIIVEALRALMLRARLPYANLISVFILIPIVYIWEKITVLPYYGSIPLSFLAVFGWPLAELIHTQQRLLFRRFDTSAQTRK